MWFLLLLLVLLYVYLLFDSYLSWIWDFLIIRYIIELKLGWSELFLFIFCLWKNYLYLSLIWIPNSSFRWRVFGLSIFSNLCWLFCCIDLDNFNLYFTLSRSAFSSLFLILDSGSLRFLLPIGGSYVSMTIIADIISVIFIMLKLFILLTIVILFFSKSSTK